MTLFIQAGKLQDLHRAFPGFPVILRRGMSEIAGRDHIFQNAQVFQRLHDLERAGDLHVCIFMSLFVRDILSSEKYFSFGRRVVTADHVKCRGFPGTVRADHACDAAFTDRERDILHRGQAFKSFGDMLNFNDWSLFHHQASFLPLRSSSTASNHSTGGFLRITVSTKFFALLPMYQPRIPVGRKRMTASRAMA